MIKNWTTDTASDGAKQSCSRRDSSGMRLNLADSSNGLPRAHRLDRLKLVSLVLVTAGLSVPLGLAESQSTSQADRNGASNAFQTIKGSGPGPVDATKSETQLRGYNNLPQASMNNGAKPIDKALSAIIGREVDLDIYPGRAPTKQMKALHVKVQNRTDEPLVFDGDHTLIASKDDGNQIAICISQMELDSVGRPPTTFRGRLSSDLKATVTAAATVGAVQTAETLKKQYGPITKRYEWDEERRENEESRFGRRLLYPGDSTDGNIYFKAGTAFSGNTLTMPVKSFYDGSDQASLSKLIPVVD